jgi:hypothetical protein
MPSGCPEDDYFNVYRNAEIASTHDVAKPRKPNYKSETGRENMRTRVDATMHAVL